MRGAWFGLALIFSAGEAWAQTNTFTGYSQLEPCRLATSRDTGSTALALQIGYCYGVANTVLSLAPHMKPETRFCPPDITNGQMIRIMVKFMDDNPHMLHESLLTIALKAARRVYPCE